jgi:hypothetical protein
MQWFLERMDAIEGRRGLQTGDAEVMAGRASFARVAACACHEQNIIHPISLSNTTSTRISCAQTSELEP